MSNGFTVSLDCKVCGPIYIVPDRFTDNPDVSPGWNVIPCGGVCPICKQRYEWSPSEMYLTSFAFGDSKVMEGDSPTVAVEVSSLTPDDCAIYEGCEPIIVEDK